MWIDNKVFECGWRKMYNRSSWLLSIYFSDNEIFVNSEIEVRDSRDNFFLLIVMEKMDLLFCVIWRVNFKVLIFEVLDFCVKEI